MSNQLHGKTIEDHFKPCFPGACDHQRSTSSQWDIEKEFDEELNLPTSIKAKGMGASSVEMADARIFWNNLDGFRLLVARWEQNGNKKIFRYVEEFLFSEENLIIIKGDLTLENIENFHNTLLSFREGQHKAARAYAKQHKKLLPKSPFIALNPKIDSKKQRRLQCSLKLNNICKIVKPTIYNEEYRDLCFPLTIKSPSRQFN